MSISSATSACGGDDRCGDVSRKKKETTGRSASPRQETSLKTSHPLLPFSRTYLRCYASNHTNFFSDCVSESSSVPVQFSKTRHATRTGYRLVDPEPSVRASTVSMLHFAQYLGIELVVASYLFHQLNRRVFRPLYDA